jgi:hypothetical protein
MIATFRKIPKIKWRIAKMLPASSKYHKEKKQRMKLVIKYLLKIQVPNTDFSYQILLLIWLFYSIIWGILLKDSQGIVAERMGKK